MALLDSCQNSAEVEMVLDDPVSALNRKKVSLHEIIKAQKAENVGGEVYF